MTTSAPVAPALLIHQTHDASGAPAPAEYRHDFPNIVVNLLTMQPVYQFLAPLNILPTQWPNVFSYTDPAHGRGLIELWGFDARACKGVADYGVMREIDAAIGMSEPSRWDGRQPGFGQPRPFKNPWIMSTLAVGITLFGIGLALFSFVLEILDPVRNDATLVLGVVFGAVFVGLGILLLVMHGRRIAWWTRARAYLRSTGREIPEDLHLFN